MQIVLFDGPVPGWSPGGSDGHSRLLSCSFVRRPVHLVPGDGSACGDGQPKLNPPEVAPE
jgi:hypothetical protein